MVAHQRRFIVDVEGRHQRSARPVSLFRYAPRQRHRVQRRRHHQFLPCPQAQPHPHRNFGKQVQFLLVRSFLSLSQQPYSSLLSSDLFEQ